MHENRRKLNFQSIFCIGNTFSLNLEGIQIYLNEKQIARHPIQF